MKKHLDMILLSSGMIIFLLTLSEIIDMSWVEMWEEGFYGSLYYWFIAVGIVLFVGGLLRKIEKINKKIDSIKKNNN